MTPSPEPQPCPQPWMLALAQDLVATGVATVPDGYGPEWLANFIAVRARHAPAAATEAEQPTKDVHLVRPTPCRELPPPIFVGRGAGGEPFGPYQRHEQVVAVIESLKALAHPPGAWLGETPT